MGVHSNSSLSYHIIFLAVTGSSQTDDLKHDDSDDNNDDDGFEFASQTFDLLSATNFVSFIISASFQATLKRKEKSLMIISILL